MDLLAPLAMTELRESLVLPVPPVVLEPLVCRECLVSVELLVSPVQREREEMLVLREAKVLLAKMAAVV